MVVVAVEAQAHSAGAAAAVGGDGGGLSHHRIDLTEHASLFGGGGGSRRDGLLGGPPQPQQPARYVSRLLLGQVPRPKPALMQAAAAADDMYGVFEC